ncbi:MAG: DinB family protein [Bernardetiaceae bacterium]|nr:DinB family protein [Bernardetiaceae bacterium]
MNIQTANQDILRQLLSFIERVSTAQFTAHLELLSGNTIGKHVRHVAEFYQHLFIAYAQPVPVVDYDARRRDPGLETDPAQVARLLLHWLVWLAEARPNRDLQLRFSLSAQGERQVLATNFYRELAYNLEHAIHHLAIIKIAVTNHFPNVTLDPHFGVAHATVQFQQQPQ